MHRPELAKPSSQFQEHFVVPVTTKRSHANGWVATVFKNEHELVEGYLWDEHRQPIEVRREGRDFNKTRQELDAVTRSRGHICSDQCETWTRAAPASPKVLWRRYRRKH